MQMHSVYSNPQPVAVHTIGRRVFKVYSHLVMHENQIIFRSHSEIISSVLLGDSFVMACRDGDLLVPWGRELRAEKLPDALSLAKHSFSMYIPLSATVSFAGSPNGRYILVKYTIHSVLLFLYDQTTHTIRLETLREFSHVGAIHITYEDGFPCLWNLVHDSTELGGVFVELYNLDPLEPSICEAVPFAKCPLMADTYVVKNEPRIYVCSMNNRTGVVCKIDKYVFFLGYRQAVVGDFASKSCLCPYEAPEISEASRITGNGVDRLIYVARPDMTVAMINPVAEGSTVFTENEPIARLPPVCDLDVFAWCVTNAEFSPSPEQNDLPFTHVEFVNFPIGKIAIDSRKRPWRILVLEEHALKLISVTKAVDEIVRTDIKQVHNLHYEPNLSTAIATTQEGANRYLSGPAIENLPTLRDNEPLVHFGMAGNHTLVAVYPTEIEIYSGMFPFPHICSLAPENVPIIGGTLGPGILVVRTYDRVCLLNLSTTEIINSNEQKGLWKELDTGKAPVTFVDCECDRVLVGLDLSRQTHRRWMNDLGILKTKAMGRFMADEETLQGGVLIFSIEGVLYDLQLHPHPPSGYRKLAVEDAFNNPTETLGSTSSVEVAAYGALGLVAWVRPLDKYISAEDLNEDEILLFESLDQEVVLVKRYERSTLALNQPVFWAGPTRDGKGVLLRGRGIFVANQETCQQLELVKENENRTQYFVSSAVSIDSDIVAFVEKQQLKLLRDINLLNGARPHTIRRANVSDAASLDMLLIKSQRLLILYGGPYLQILDSSTLQPLEFKHSSYRLAGKAVALWRFVNDDGISYEHIVTFDGLRTLESCTLQRSGNKLSSELKFRFTLDAAYIDSANSSQKDLIMPVGNLVYLCTNQWLAVINPVVGIVHDEYRLGASAKHISFASDSVIITTKSRILVLKYLNGRLSLHTEIKQNNTIFVKHVAQIIPSKCKSEHSIYILAMVMPLEPQHPMLKGYIVQDREIIPMRIPRHIKQCHKILFACDIIADPEAPDIRDYLLCYVVMSDHTISCVEISPHNTEPSPFTALF